MEWERYGEEEREEKRGGDEKCCTALCLQCISFDMSK